MTAEHGHDINERLNEFFQAIDAMRGELADIEVPGWYIGRPSIEQLSEDLAFMTARSKPGEVYPFLLPNTGQTAIAVVEGRVQIESPTQDVIVGRRFHVLPAGPDRKIVPLESHTRICCVFFRSRVADQHGPATDTR